MNQFSQIAAQSATTFDMAAALEQFGGPKQAQPGTIITGDVVRVDKFGAWIDFGGKSDALVPPDKFGNTEPKAGDTGVFYVEAVPVDEGQRDAFVICSAKRAECWSRMSAAKDTGETITVKVHHRGIRRNRSNGIAGVVVQAGDLQGFIPYSMLAVRGKAVESLGGQELQAKVSEVNANERKLVFDNTAAQAEITAKLEAERDAMLQTIQPGEIRTGTVVRIATTQVDTTGGAKKTVEFGAFVDIGGGLHGLLHKSELADSSKPASEQLKEGDVITVKVINAKIEGGKRKLGLSIKQVQSASFLGSLKAGDIVSGTVGKVMPFGAFVKLSDSVEGLLHQSEFSSTYRGDRRPDGTRGEPRKAMTTGDALSVRVLEVDPAAGRIKLTLKGVPQNRRNQA